MKIILYGEIKEPNNCSGNCGYGDCLCDGYYDKESGDWIDGINGDYNN